MRPAPHARFGQRLGNALGAFVAAWRAGGDVRPYADSERPVRSAPHPQPAVVASGPDSQRTRGRLRGEALQRRSPAEHANALLLWLQGPGGLSGSILATELQAIHREMCAEAGWEARPWNPIARQLALMLSGGKKTWAWIRDERGRRHRLRTYHIPPARPTPVPVARQPAGDPPTPERMAA